MRFTARPVYLPDASILLLQELKKMSWNNARRMLEAVAPGT